MPIPGGEITGSEIWQQTEELPVDVTENFEEAIDESLFDEEVVDDL